MTYKRLSQRWTSCFLALCLVLSLLPGLTVEASAATVSGTCGKEESDALYWTLDTQSGILTVQGRGEMMSCMSGFDADQPGAII